MTDKKFYIVLDGYEEQIYNNQTEMFYDIIQHENVIYLNDNNILLNADTFPNYNSIIEIDKFGNILNEVDVELDFSNVSDEFKNEHELYIFDDTDINQVILDNIEEIINFSDVTPINIQNILENCDILHTDSDYKDFLVELLNVDFESVGVFRSCLSVDKIKNWIKNTYDCNGVTVDDDITIIVHA